MTKRNRNFASHLTDAYNAGRAAEGRIAFLTCLIAFNNVFGEEIPDEKFTEYEKELADVYGSYIADVRDNHDLDELDIRLRLIVRDIRRRRGMEPMDE